MKMLHVFWLLGPADARNIGRESLLRGLLFVPLLAALGARLVLPTVLARLGVAVGVDMSAHYAPMMSVILLLLSPILCGALVGFLLLDQRDEGTLMALRVTPLPLPAYLAYRLTLPMLFSIVVSLPAFPLAGLHVTPLALLLGVVLAAPLAPLFALAFAAFTANKVQGLALQKASGVFVAAPLAAMFTPPGWDLLFGIVPTYWPAKVYWSAAEGDPMAWLYFLIGLTYTTALISLLLRQWLRREGQN